MKAQYTRLCDKLKEEADLAGPSSVERVRYRVFLSHVNPTSGLWLQPGVDGQDQLLSNREYLSACCKRNTIENPFIPRANPFLGEQARHEFLCRFSTNRTPTYIDPFGYHLVGCKVDAHAIRLHDNVVHKLVVLLRSLGLVVSLEPISLLTDIISDDNRRPDIFICNPYGGVI